MDKPIIIGVAGGTASGKTTVSRKILETIGLERLAYVEHDAYYRDLSHLPFEERQKFNFDHPDSLENELMISHLEALRMGRPIEMPVYDFAQYTRTNEVRLIEPRPVILVEGILVFVDRPLRKMMDFKIYVDAPADLRFIRRLQRDVVERGRSVSHVIEQYLGTVRPMHLEFVEPSKRHADIVVTYREVETVFRLVKMLVGLLGTDG